MTSLDEDQEEQSSVQNNMESNIHETQNTTDELQQKYQLISKGILC